MYRREVYAGNEVRFDMRNDLGSGIWDLGSGIWDLGSGIWGNNAHVYYTQQYTARMYMIFWVVDDLPQISCATSIVPQELHMTSQVLTSMDQGSHSESPIHRHLAERV